MTLKSVWLAFAPYVVVSSIHIAALFTGHSLHAPTKLALMPLLAVAVLITLATVSRDSSWQVEKRRIAWGTTGLLLFGIGASWLGDGAGTFFPMFDDELPMMLLWFGVAHLAYMALFWRAPRIRMRRSLPKWTIVYGVVYLVLITLLAPHTGLLTVPVIVYGLVLAGTATLASLVSPVVAWGGCWFLVSDAMLAFHIFTPDSMPEYTSGLVMITYTLGQLLIAYGVTKRILATRLQRVA